MPKVKKPKSIPFQFVVDALQPAKPYTRPMFGCHALYVEEKIMIILREKENYPEDNGVWIATTKEHHDSLKLDFPSMRSIQVFGGKVTGWQVLPVKSRDFEESALTLVELILQGDERIGKIPAPRRGKNKIKAKAKARKAKAKAKGKAKRR
jgi:hypothetical protein